MRTYPRYRAVWPGVVVLVRDAEQERRIDAAEVRVAALFLGAGVACLLLAGWVMLGGGL